MMLLLAGGLALWLLAVLIVLSVCRAAARADENDAGRRLVRASRRGVSVGLAAAVVTVPGIGGEADARRQACANRNVEFEIAPQDAREALICEIDRLRARRGLRKLDVDGRLAKAARRHANDMVDRHYFSHYSPAGSDVADRARRTGYAKRTCAWRLGEVLAWGVEGRSTAAATVDAWLDSPDHRRILVSNRYSDLGVGTVAGTPELAFPHGLTAAAVLGRRHCST
jgi:Cysteine-rich secretory protein family